MLVGRARAAAARERDGDDRESVYLGNFSGMRITEQYDKRYTHNE
jgi:hypothetical protein